MKRGYYALVVSLVLLQAGMVYGQGAEGDSILGRWSTAEGKALVEIYKCEDFYCGRIVWLKEPMNKEGKEKTDMNNPDPSKRERKILGSDIVWNFVYDRDMKWKDGKIYDPDNGKTYSCKMELVGDELRVRGFIGFSLLGRTTVWNRKQ